MPTSVSAFRAVSISGSQQKISFKLENDDFVEQITAGSNSQSQTWTATRSALPNGDVIYTRDQAPFWFIIREDGQMYSGFDYLTTLDIGGGMNGRGEPLTGLPLFRLEKGNKFPVPIYENVNPIS